MPSIILVVVIGLAVGIGLIIAFAIYLAPRLNLISDQERYERNLAILSADAECTASDCAITIVKQCEISKKIVVPKEGYYVWIIQARSNESETCRMELTDKYVPSVGGMYDSFVSHDCYIPSEVLAESRTTPITAFVGSILSDERTHCGISMP